MNWVWIIVIIIMLWSIGRGRRKGLIGIAYSLLSIALAILFVTLATPYITEYLEQHTTLSAQIELRCEEYVKNAAQKNTKDMQEKEIKKLSPVENSVLTDILDLGMGTMGNVLEESGAYTAMAKQLAHFIINGIAFFLALLLSAVCLYFLGRLLNLAARLPLLREVNHFFGTIAGAAQGILLVWLLFYFVTVCCTSETAGFILEDIRRSRILTWLYQNNMLLYLIEIYF